MPSIFQKRRGPPLGQEFSNPVSGEIPSRLGPRHCGQSAAEANAQIDKQRRRMERHPDMWDKVTAAAGAMASGGRRRHSPAPDGFGFGTLHRKGASYERSA